MAPPVQVKEGGRGDTKPESNDEPDTLGEKEDVG